MSKEKLSSDMNKKMGFYLTVIIYVLVIITAFTSIYNIYASLKYREYEELAKSIQAVDLNIVLNK